MASLLLSIAPILLTIFVTQAGAIIAIVFYLSKKVEKIESNLDSSGEKVVLQFEGLKKTLELNMEIVSKSNDSINARVSRLEQFKDDYYADRVFKTFLPGEK